MRTRSLVTFIVLLAATATADFVARQAEPSPTGLGACVLQDERWSCELSSATASAPANTDIPVATSSTIPTASTTAALLSPSEPSPTNQGHCEAHGDHWHCEGESEDGHDHEDHSHEGHSHGEGEDAHAGHNHAGHSHGPSAEFGCGLAPLEGYNMGLHVAAIFILLAASSAGVILSFLGKWMQRGDGSSPFSSAASHITFAMRHFGGGVILSTAFIHLLFHAFVYFPNECIGTLAFEAASPAIAMGAVYVVFLLDFLVLRRHRRQAMEVEQANAQIKRQSLEDSTEKQSETSQYDRLVLEDGQKAEMKLQKCNVLALEAGIIFHSVIIGVTIGTASGAGWVPLLIAITFHQFCEGIALASRIALLSKLTTSALEKISMCLAFCLTTPLGIAIGIGVRQSFNTNGRGTILAVGILDSISAGILLYAALVQILVGDFIHNKDMINASVTTCLSAVFWFTAGAIVMSVLGLWA